MPLLLGGVVQPYLSTSGKLVFEVGDLGGQQGLPVTSKNLTPETIGDPPGKTKPPGPKVPIYIPSAELIGF